MNATAVALLGTLLWFLLLLMSIGIMRSALVFRGKKRANSFKPSGEDVSPFSHRLCRAHANCYEYFPVYGGLMLLALATDNTQVTDPLAYAFLAARLGQSITHLLSTRNLAVNFRFFFFLFQIAIALVWLFGLLQVFV